MDTAPVSLNYPIAPEDAARAELYALLSALYARGPDAALLASLRAAAPWPADGTQSLGAAWNRLLDASKAMDPDAADQEYTEVFVGVGKSEVNLHGSHWQVGFMMEKPLAELRADLAALGLARQPGVTMLEDHLSALCETMRILIAGNADRRPATIAVQRRFFERHVASWVFQCCNAVIKCSLANYYVRVAEFTSMFLAVERDSLAME